MLALGEPEGSQAPTRGARKGARQEGCETKVSPGHPKCTQATLWVPPSSLRRHVPQRQKAYMLMESFYTEIFVSQVTNSPKNSYHGSWGDKSHGAQDAICLQENKRETFRSPCGGSRARWGADHTLSSPSVLPFTEDKRREAANAWRKAKPCSLRPRGSAQGDRSERG